MKESKFQQAANDEHKPRLQRNRRFFFWRFLAIFGGLSIFFFFALGFVAYLVSDQLPQSHFRSSLLYIFCGVPLAFCVSVCCHVSLSSYDIMCHHLLSSVIHNHTSSHIICVIRCHHGPLGGWGLTCDVNMTHQVSTSCAHHWLHHISEALQIGRASCRERV